MPAAYLFTVPMYNITMPSVFKAWLDQLIVFDRTVIHGGPSPAAGRPAVLISARGGAYGPGAPREGLDYVVPLWRPYSVGTSCSAWTSPR